MLTVAEIERVCENSGHRLHKAQFPVCLHPRRTLFVSERVRQLITATASGMDEKMRGRWLTARAVLEAFVDGDWITTKSKPKSRAEMAILCPWSDGIWEFRDVRPKPSLRILGAFMEKDVFIAPGPYERAELGQKGSQEWSKALDDFKAQWKELFDGHKPMSGGKYPDDYLSLSRSLD
jgi:hypothetical protein